MATPSSNDVPVTFNLPRSFDNDIDSLLFRAKWGGLLGTSVTLTYSFPTGAAFFDADYSEDNEWGAGDPLIDWYELSPQQQGAFEEALATISNVAGITFVELPDNETTVGEIRVAMSDAVSLDDDEFGATLAWAYLPGNFPAAGDVWLSPTLFLGTPIEPGSLEYVTLIHELGHAVGLKHPFDIQLNNFATLPVHLDNMFYTVMSYTDDPSGNGFFPDRWPTTPMLLDVKALQYIYGPNVSFNAGNTIHAYSESGAYLETIWDSGGTDTIDYTESTGGAIIDLREGEWSSLGQPVAFYDGFGVEQYTDPRTVWIAYGAQIENAWGGAGDDWIIGNELRNELLGHDGDDLLTGLGGGDTLFGGAGNDTLEGGSGPDLLYGGDSADSLLGGPGQDILYGEAGDDELYGGNGGDVLYGGAGNDLLRGGPGHDTLHGDAGHNELYGGAGADELWGGTGNDTLHGDGVSDLLFGQDGDDLLSGDGGSDTLYGGPGNDTLDGGPGADWLYGGPGDDLYIVRTSADVVVEEPGEGRDAVQAWLDYQLPSHVEDLVLLGGAREGIGNNLDNKLTGNDSDNLLDGQGGDDLLYGGTGRDVLRGGAGSDTLYGDDGNDRLFGQGGDDLLYGGAGDDILNGGPGSDTLDGGAGADLLRGGPENDLYVVRSAGDVVAERLDEGLDSVHAYVDFQLPSHVETLTLLDGAGIGIGNNLSNAITGNDGDNRLEGRGGDDVLFGGFGDDTLVGGPGDDGLDGGAGNDSLRGGPGDDQFIFNAPLGPGNVDRIADFSDGADRIVLVSEWFPEAGSEITAENFIANDGGTATSTAHRIIYNTGSGALYYDADGSGAGAPVLFAVLENDYLLTHDDFEVLS